MENIVFDQAHWLLRLGASVTLTAAGIVILTMSPAPAAVPWVFFALAILALGIRQRLVLNPLTNTWTRENGLWPLVVRRSGRFSDLKAIELSRGVESLDRGRAAYFTAYLVWNSKKRQHLYSGSSVRTVAESAATLSRAIDVPVTETDDLREFRARFRDLPMLDE